MMSYLSHSENAFDNSEDVVTVKSTKSTKSLNVPPVTPVLLFNVLL